MELILVIQSIKTQSNETRKKKREIKKESNSIRRILAKTTFIYNISTTIPDLDPNPQTKYKLNSQPIEKVMGICRKSEEDGIIEE